MGANLLGTRAIWIVAKAIATKTMTITHRCVAILGSHMAGPRGRDGQESDAAPYRAIRPQLPQRNARTLPAVGYLPVQKLTLSSGRRYSSSRMVPLWVNWRPTLSMRTIGDIDPRHSAHVRVDS